MKIENNQLLIIIDPQKDFTTLEGAYAKRHSSIDKILHVKEQLNALLKTIPEEKVLIVCSDYEINQFGKGVSMCISGTPGHEADLEINNAHKRIYKTEHSCFSSSPFREHLKNNGIKELILTGFLAEYCVKQTAQDGLSLGYNIMLPANLIATGDDVQEKKEQTLHELKEKGATITNI